MNPESTAIIEDRSASPMTAEAIRRMYCVDTSHNQRLPVLMELVGSVSRAQTPQEISHRFSNGLQQLFDHSAYLAISTRGLKPGEFKITRFYERGGQATGPHDPWAQWSSLPTHRGGFIGELIRSAWPEIIHNLDITDDPVIGDLLAPYGSLMAVPVFDGGEPLNWGFVLGEDPQAFDEKDLEEMIMRANLIGGITKGKVVQLELKAAQAKINHEVERIADIQRSLLPDPLPQIDGVRLASSYRTSAKAGGDYYDFFALDHIEHGRPDPGGRWGMLVADASGHGPSAAVVMAMLHAILHAFADGDHSPSAMMEKANRHLHAKKIESSFVTAFYAIYDPKSRTFTYARAGHNPPLLKDGKTIERLEHVGGIPLGIDPEWTYDDHSITLKPDQTLVLYTDGITEAMNTSRRMFGTAGIEKSLHHCTGEPDCTLGSINTALDQHTGGGDPDDDQTIVAMRIE